MRKNIIMFFVGMTVLVAVPMMANAFVSLEDERIAKSSPVADDTEPQYATAVDIQKINNRIDRIESKLNSGGHRHSATAHKAKAAKHATPKAKKIEAKKATKADGAGFFKADSSRDIAILTLFVLVGFISVVGLALNARNRAAHEHFQLRE